MEDLPHAFTGFVKGAHDSKEATPRDAESQRDLIFDTPILGGIMGAAQLSTAMLLGFPNSATDIGITGAGGVYLGWTIPVGCALGVLAGRLLLRLPRRFHVRSGVIRNWKYALVPSLFVAPMAPMFLGLGPQTPSEHWQGFAAISAIVWCCIIVLTQLERRRAR